MKVEDKITRAKIQLQRRNSFFAYLSLYLKFKESKNLPDWAGMGVDEKGNCSYKKEFVEKLSDEELISVITHEILHLALLHLIRRRERNPELWNISADICVNTILKDNNFHLPNGCLIPDSDYKIKVFNQEIENCNKKTSEEVYNELKIPKGRKQKGGSGKGKGKKGDEEDNEGEGECKGRFDKHFDTEGLSEKERRELEKEWLGKTQEALTLSKMKGDIPIGIERLVGELHKEEINWKALLYNYITRQIPYDYTWAKPSKKSISIGEYLPDILKEKIDIVVCIDVSGSIGQDELIDFLSEIIGIAKVFRERIKIQLLTHETQINDDYVVENGNIEKIKGINIKGGGGTSHIGAFKYIKENVKDSKCVIFLTDCCSDLNEINFDEYSFDKVFVISRNGNDNQLKDKKCNIIKLKGER